MITIAARNAHIPARVAVLGMDSECRVALHPANDWELDICVWPHANIQQYSGKLGNIPSSHHSFNRTLAVLFFPQNGADKRTRREHQNWIVDAFFPYSAAAMAAASLLRSISGCVLPIFADALFIKLGYGLGGTLLALISIVSFSPSDHFFFTFDHHRDQ